jgi:hypothetical protein
VRSVRSEEKDISSSLRMQISVRNNFARTGWFQSSERSGTRTVQTGVGRDKRRERVIRKKSKYLKSG